MINLSTEDIHILDDGLNYQFCAWDQGFSRTLHYLINKVNSKQLPAFWQMDSETQWDFICALYCAYSIDGPRKSFNYTKTDVAKLTDKITGRSMQFTVDSINQAWSEIE